MVIFNLITYPYTHLNLNHTKIIILTRLLKYFSLKSDICYIYRPIFSILARGTPIHIWAYWPYKAIANLTCSNPYPNASPNPNSKYKPKAFLTRFSRKSKYGSACP